MVNRELKILSVVVIFFALCIFVLYELHRSPGIKSFDDTIDSIRNNEFIVNCSDAVNRGKTEVNDIGYLCSIHVDATTELKSNQGNTIQMDDFSAGDKVRIISSKSINFQKKRNFTAKEIILLEKAPKE
ncbi:hypothetical protein A8990_12631 [Paenibacillus taihuensis]|uniref:Uncharacterized protein n=1 Tax=Paenibacillus taihuensis TaxID=1156355 RepID=A0A3D9RID5_9BACL|nr:hypothetical protein [Paenibacillus taihuensis]REE78557.1 hypothetical protein A8990_12631 [Paenibacillus taihuensis]